MDCSSASFSLWVIMARLSRTELTIARSFSVLSTRAGLVGMGVGSGYVDLGVSSLSELLLTIFF